MDENTRDPHLLWITDSAMTFRDGLYDATTGQWVRLPIIGVMRPFEQLEPSS